MRLERYERDPWFLAGYIIGLIIKYVGGLILLGYLVHWGWSLYR